MRRPALLLSICLAAVLSAEPPAPSGPAAAPPEADIAAQQQTVRNLYKSDYAAKDPAKRMELAQRLLQLSATGTAAERVSLLREAILVAAKAGDLDTARGACDTLVSGWKVDAATERLTLYQAANIATVEQAIGAAGDLLAAADAATSVDAFATAQKLADAAGNFARKGRDEALAKRAKTVADESRDLASEFAKVSDGADLLGEHSPSQLTALGRFYALSKGDWNKALPLLATCDDAALKAAAIADLAAKTASEKETVGETWADLAKKAQPKQKPQFFRRALDSLGQAADGSTGMAKAKLDKRIADLEQQAGKPRGSAAAAPPGVLFWLDGEPGPDGKSIVDAGPFKLKPEIPGKVQILREGHGGYLRFDGSGGITMPLKTPVPASSPISIALWVRNGTKQERSGIIGIGQGGNILVHPNGATHFVLDFVNKCGLPQIDLGEPGNGVWRHIAFVMDPLKKETFIYLDGVQAKRSPGPTSPLAAPIDSIQVGTSRWGPIIGDLDSIGFWNRVLSPDEVKALHASGKNGRGGG